MTLQIRRGSQVALNSITPDLAEPIYTTDTHKLYIGDGVTPGGILVGGEGALSTATTSTLGGIIVGNNLTIDGSGRLSAIASGGNQPVNTTSSVTFSNLTVTNTLYATEIVTTSSQVTVRAYNGFQVATGAGYSSAINTDNISGYSGYNLYVNSDETLQGDLLSAPLTNTGGNIGTSGTPFRRLYVNTATVTGLKIGSDAIITSRAELIGPTGPSGAQGAAGSTGYTGSKGDTGSTGAEGPQGPQGPIGYTGSQGNIGYTGSQGNTGSEGPQGPQGPIGYTGSKGDIGYTGSVGAQGPQGPQGATGQNNSLYDYKAKVGQTTGDPGENYMLWNNATQASATTLHFSHIDNIGDDIEFLWALVVTGDVIRLQDQTNSEQYQTWTVTGTPTINTGTYISVPVSLTTSTHSFSNNDILLVILRTAGVQGPTGPQGPSGATGPQGPIGYTGSQGNIGYTGSAGPQGPQGPGANQSLDTTSNVTFNSVISTVTATIASSTIGLNNGARSFGNGYMPTNSANMKIELPTNGSSLFFAMKNTAGVEKNLGISRQGNLVFPDGIIGLGLTGGLAIATTDNTGFPISATTLDDDGSAFADDSGITMDPTNGVVLNNGRYVYATDSYSSYQATFDPTGKLTSPELAATNTATVGSLKFSGDGINITSRASLIGPQGPQGPIGYTGSASTVSGPQGPQGAEGPQGPQGAQGNIGYTGSASTVSGPSGPIGYTGSAGAGGSFTGGTLTSLLTIKGLSETVYDWGSVAAGTYTPDATTATVHKMTLTGNVTISALANVSTGSNVTLILTQDGTGARTLTSTMKFAGGSKILSTVGTSTDMISIFYDGATYWASLSKGFA